MKYTIALPPRENELQNNANITLDNNSLIIIGANGAGKSRLGAWIEKHDERVHRIGAQRSLVFGEYIDQKSYEQSVCQLLYGRDKPTPIDNKSKWPWDGESHNYISGMLDDYKYALSAFWAKYSLECEKYINECRDFDRLGKKHNNVPEMVTDKLTKIWKSIFPHRDIQIKDAKVTAILNIKETPEKKEYAGKNMSDGERVVLYLIAQALSIPEGKIIIIDEPEIHIHRSIMNKLWEAIEKERRDCLFVYITHDTQFAAQHIGAKKLWIKSYDGHQWDWEFIEESQLPEQLLLDILGNRKPVIFVEGNKDSFDTKLYSLIFKDFYVIPCEGCDSVITRTTAMKQTNQLHELECYGIIDRDYRSEHEIQTLMKHNIYPLNVAEVENLFLVPEVLKIIGKIANYNEEEVSQKVEEVKSFIIDKRFKGEINEQILNAVISEIKYKLSKVDLSPKDDVKNKLNNITEKIYDELYQEKSELFNKALIDRNYEEILKIFNKKELGKYIGTYWSIDNKQFYEWVLRNAATGEFADELLGAIALYTPKADIMKAHHDALNSARTSEGVSENDSEA